MQANNKQLTILSEAEQAALYDSPDFDDNQRLEFFSFTPEEVVLMNSCSGLAEKVHCALQIGYFKAKHFFC